MAFHEKLKELRLQNNLSQEQLARKFGITTGTYLFYETGKRYPSVKMLAQMAEFFEMSISSLFDEHLSVEKVFGEIHYLFTNGELCESEKDAVMEALQKAYQKAKKKNKQT